MKRTFWFGLGVAAGVAATRKVSDAMRKATPAGAAASAADTVGSAVRDLAAAVGSFGADVRAGMAEREVDLHRGVAERTGVDTTPRHLLDGAGWTLPEQAHADARARRAGGSAARV